MDFDEAMTAVAALNGIEVGATVWGLGDDASDVVTLQGTLKSPDSSESEFPTSVEVDETAVTFGVGDHWGNDLVFWPSRFVTAERTHNGVQITTLDARVVVEPNRPWID